MNLNIALAALGSRRGFLTVATCLVLAAGVAPAAHALDAHNDAEASPPSQVVSVKPAVAFTHRALAPVSVMELPDELDGALALLGGPVIPVIGVPESANDVVGSWVLSDSLADQVVVNPEDIIVDDDDIVVDPDDDIVVDPDDDIVVDPDEDIVVDPDEDIVVDPDHIIAESQPQSVQLPVPTVYSVNDTVLTGGGMVGSVVHVELAGSGQQIARAEVNDLGVFVARFQTPQRSEVQLNVWSEFSTVASDSVTISVDADQPLAPQVTFAQPELVTGMAEPGALVLVSAPGGGEVLGFAIAERSGTFAAHLRPEAQGSSNVSLVAIDAAMNQSVAVEHPLATPPMPTPTATRGTESASANPGNTPAVPAGTAAPNASTRLAATGGSVLGSCVLGALLFLGASAVFCRQCRHVQSLPRR